MAFNINEIVSAVNGNGGVLTPSYFVVNIRPPKWALSDDIGSNTKELFRFICYNANHPGMSLTTERVRRQGIGLVEKRPVDFNFDNLRLNFFIDGRGLVFKFFQKWMQNIHNFDVSTGPDNSYNDIKKYEYGYPDDYETTVDIIVASPADERILQTTIYNAYPTNISSINLDWARPNELAILTVDFTFKYYTNEAVDHGSTQLTNSTSFLTIAELLYVDPRVAAAYTITDLTQNSSIAGLVNAVDNYAVPLLHLF